LGVVVVMVVVVMAIDGSGNIDCSEKRQNDGSVMGFRP
jgi:hypothetical protein